MALEAGNQFGGLDFGELEAAVRPYYEERAEGLTRAQRVALALGPIPPAYAVEVAQGALAFLTESLSDTTEAQQALSRPGVEGSNG